VHIPDGYLDAKTCLGAYCLAGASLAWAGRNVGARWNERTIPLLGVMSAFVFAGQMVNFPVAGGTSGHLLGGVLAGVLLGPAAASMALTTVLVVQCFLFQDGGISALGANALNLAVVGVFGGCLVYRLIRRCRRDPRSIVLGSALAAWFSVVLASATCALELAGAGTAPARLVLPAMILTHAVIGVGEALITAAVVGFVVKVRPDLVYEPRTLAPVSTPIKRVVMVGLAGALGVALLLSPLASTLPDGFERVAQQLGLTLQTHGTNLAPMPGYSVPGASRTWLMTSAVAVLGTLLCFGVGWLLVRLAARWLRRSPP
jgi:cobalt/nickel transport system permease protein